MKGVHFPVTAAALSVLAFATLLASASDPGPLQDFCVAINNTDSAVFVNGKFCKDPKLALANDFFSDKLRYPGNTSNPVGSIVTAANVDDIPGLNTLDVFVFPIGLIHFQLNVGKTNALAIAGLSSQNPGVITIANAVFGSNPPINPDVLAKAFQVDDNVVDYLQKQFWYNNS
ncbi:unnamed protein product [Malus baccata var. baccata]